MPISPNRMRHRKLVSVPLERTVLSADLRSLGPLELHEVSTDPVRKAVFETLLAEEHYLGYRSAVDEKILRHLSLWCGPPQFAEARSPHGEPVSNPQPIDGDFLIEEQIMPDYENVITD